METLADIRVTLNAASDRIDRGQVRQPQVFLDDLWSRVYENAPVDLQPYVWSRLMDIGARLGVYAGGPPRRQPPASHYRL